MPRIAIAWDLTSGEDDLVWEMDTSQIASVFAVPKDAHPEIVRCKAIEKTSTGDVAQIIADPRSGLGANTKELETGGMQELLLLADLNKIEGSMLTRDFLFFNCLVGTGFMDIDHPPEAMGIWNKLVFRKGLAATQFLFIIDYRLILGALDWTSEMAKLWGQIRKISPERSAGGIGFQPADRFRQVGGLGGEDHGDG